MEMVNVLYDFGRFQYSCGDYVNAAERLYQFRVLVGRPFDRSRSFSSGRMADVR